MRLPAWHRSAFVLGTLALQAAKLAVAFAAARLLAPDEFADWNKLILLLQYSTYVQLGATMAVNRDYALLLGAGDEARARRVGGAALAVALLTTVPFAAVGAWTIDLADLWLYAAFAALPPLTALVLLNQALLRASNGFRRLGVLLGVEAAGWALLVLPFIAWRHSAGFVAVVDLLLVGLLAAYGTATRDALARFRIADARAVIAGGLPLAAAAATWTLRQTGDLLVALWRFDTTVFAALGVATIFVRALYTVPTLTNLLWLPDLARTFGAMGASGLRARTNTLLRRYVPAIAVLLVGLACIAYVTCSTVLDRYEEFRWLVTVKVAAEGATLLATVLTMYLSVVKRSRVLVAANLTGLAPYGLLLLIEPTRGQLTAAIAASAALYLTVVVAGWARVARLDPEASG